MNLDHGHKGRLCGRRATHCLSGTSRTTAAVGEDPPVSASEIPVARRKQHKMKIRRHDGGLHKPWGHCTLKHVLCPPTTGDTVLLASALSEVRVWQTNPDHRTGLGQLARARTRLSLPRSTYAGGCLLGSGPDRSEAEIWPPPARGSSSSSRRRGWSGLADCSPHPRAQVASAGTWGCFLLRGFPGLEAEAPRVTQLRTGTITTWVYRAPGPHRGLSGLAAAPRAGRSPRQEARAVRTGPEPLEPEPGGRCS